jgi:hypothetical protein
MTTPTPQEPTPAAPRPAPRQPRKVRKDWSGTFWGCLLPLVLLGCLVGAGYGVYRLIFTDDEPAAFDRVPADVDKLSAVCTRSKFLPTAEAVAGPGPHAAVAFGDDSFKVSMFAAAGKPDPVRDAWTPTDVTKVRIVACADRTGDGGTVKSCAYNTGSKDLEEGRYELTAYELKTRRKLGSTTIIGAEQRCPGVTNNKSSIYTRPSMQQFQDFLRPYVEQA